MKPHLSLAAKKRLSLDPAVRSKHMSDLAKLRHSRLTPEERSAHAKIMRKAQDKQP